MWLILLCVFVLQDGSTALHLAAAEGHAAVVKDLLRKGADPLRRNKVGCSRCHVTLQHVQADNLCKLSFTAGANLAKT